MQFLGTSLHRQLNRTDSYYHIISD